MRTLFSENILSPLPTPTPAPTADPFESLFPSSSNNAVPSTETSPVQRDWLTQASQNQALGHGPEDLDRAPNASSMQRSQYARRKGNPSLLLTGLRRSGKSSIQKVVFQKMSAADTLFLDPTTSIETARLESFITFDSAELPSHLLPYAASGATDYQAIFNEIGAVIWVIDAQDEFLPSIAALIQTAVFIAERYPRMHFEVFIHKTDGLSEEYKNDTFREIRQRVQDELSDLGYGARQIAYYQTSIFDHSVFEAMSKVVQKLLPQFEAMEALLNKLCSTCRIQKAYLFDTVSKMYVATDASPTSLQDYEVCSDYVDVVVDIKQIYGGWRRDEEDGEDGQKGDEGAVGESMVTYDRSGDTYIYTREINDYLSLMCVMGKGSSADKRVLIDYNVGILQDALVQIFNV